MARPQDYLALQDRAQQAESLLGHAIFNEAVEELDAKYLEQLRLQPINSTKVLEIHAKIKVLQEIVGELRSMVTDVKMARKQSPLDGRIA